MPISKSQSHKKNWGAQVVHGVERKHELGNTNTPEEVARVVVERTVAPHLTLNNCGRWLEPAVGAGNFYFAVMDHWIAMGGDPLTLAQQFDAVDIDPEAVKVFKQRLQERYKWDDNITNSLPIYVFDNGLLDFTPQHTYDWIITNPPYLSPRNWGSEKISKEDMLQQWQSIIPQADNRADLFIYFFHWCHQHLNDDGRSVFLCSDGWLDSGYGQSLRDEVMGGHYHLETLISWPWKALFRDDTCPIVTVVHKGQGETHLVIDDRNPLTNPPQSVYRSKCDAPLVWEQTLSAQELAQWLSNNTINRRQRLVTSPDLYTKLEQSLNNLQHMTQAHKVLDISGFSWSMQDLERAGLVQEHDPNQERIGQAVFFQKQARVGKPVDYRQHRTTNSLSHSVILGDDALSKKVKKLGGRTGGLWISQAIDRFPLMFTQSPSERSEWIGVSKYLHFAPKDMHHASLWTAILTSTPMLLMLERTLKEGTRKTLRVNENGYAKEIRKTDWDDMSVPDISAWSEDTIASILQHQAQRGVVSLHRLDETVNNAHWQAIDQLVMDAMHIDRATQDVMQKLSVALYWRRMRNILEYGHAHTQV